MATGPAPPRAREAPPAGERHGLSDRLYARYLRLYDAVRPEWDEIAALQVLALHGQRAAGESIVLDRVAIEPEEAPVERTGIENPELHGMPRAILRSSPRQPGCYTCKP